ncbi:hypothetical protein R3P38DRAFT_2801529 [Favolaschia claudopus]|uniref:Uncharacterized protein n=1 Tax=Favolaschia claudopus TaxID=2862362 RepID=A0AAV9ZVE5_9AGAR
MSLADLLDFLNLVAFQETWTRGEYFNILPKTKPLPAPCIRRRGRNFTSFTNFMQVEVKEASAARHRHCRIDLSTRCCHSLATATTTSSTPTPTTEFDSSGLRFAEIMLVGELWCLTLCIHAWVYRSAAQARRHIPRRSNIWQHGPCFDLLYEHEVIFSVADGWARAQEGRLAGGRSQTLRAYTTFRESWGPNSSLLPADVRRLSIPTFLFLAATTGAVAPGTNELPSPLITPTGVSVNHAALQTPPALSLLRETRAAFIFPLTRSRARIISASSSGSPCSMVSDFRFGDC